MVGKLKLLQLLIILTMLSSILIIYANPPEIITLPVSRGKLSSGNARELLIEKRAINPTVIRNNILRTPSSKYFITFKIIGGMPNEVRKLLKERSALNPPKPVKLSFHIDSLKPGEPIASLKFGVYSGYVEYEGGYKRPIIWEVFELADASIDAIITFDIGGTLAPGYGDEYGGYTLVRVNVIVDWSPSNGPLFIGVIDYNVDPGTAHGTLVYGGHASISLYPPYNRYHYHTLVIGNLGSTTISYTGHVQWQTAYENEPSATEIEG